MDDNLLIMLLIDAANDKTAAGAKVGGQELRRSCGTTMHAPSARHPYEIEAEIEDNDYDLAPGDFAIDVERSNIPSS